jgi:hypothetical protein
VNVGDGRVLTIKGGENKEAQPITAERFSGRSHQLWYIYYTDNMRDEAYIKKGKRDNDHNFIALEPFYLRSKLPMQRVAECVGASNITLKKWANNRKAQKFQFDPVSKTLRNMNWTSYAFSMEGNNLRCRIPKSRYN